MTCSIIPLFLRWLSDMKKKKKSSDRKVLQTLKTLVSVLAVAYLIYIFTFYIDGEMGAIIIAFMISAPTISFFIALYGRNRINVDIDCDSFVKKGSELKVKVIVNKKGVLPLALVEITPLISEVFEENTKTYKLSMLNEEKIEFVFSVKAETGGNGEVSIKSVYSCGFLGFVKLKAKTVLPQPKCVGVIPVIPDIKPSTQLFKNVADLVMTSENDEDNDTSMVFSANTAPGYEHREYVQGDPLKRVNWKLSSKKSKLMIRLDEAASAVQPLIVLDLYREEKNNTKNAIIHEEKLLESVFGLLTLLIKQGIACTFISRNYNGEIIIENVDNPDYPLQLLLKVISVKVTKERIDLNCVNEKICTCIIASTDFSESIDTVLRAIPDKENVCGIAPYHVINKSTDIPIWYLDNDNNFKLV